RLINNVLDFSRLEQGRHRLQTEVITPSSLVEKVIDMFERRTEEAKFEIVYQPAYEGRISVARDAFEQVLINLTDNALKYASECGKLEISERLSNGYYELKFRDYGPGIPPKYHPQVFSAFWRADTKITSDKSGTGLGLSISHRLLQE